MITTPEPPFAPSTDPPPPPPPPPPVFANHKNAFPSCNPPFPPPPRPPAPPGSAQQPLPAPLPKYTPKL